MVSISGFCFKQTNKLYPNQGQKDIALFLFKNFKQCHIKSLVDLYVMGGDRDQTGIRTPLHTGHPQGSLNTVSFRGEV